MGQDAIRLIATANAHLDASEQSILSHANGLELLRALEASEAQNADLVAALREAQQFILNQYSSAEIGELGEYQMLEHIDAALAKAEGSRGR